MPVYVADFLASDAVFEFSTLEIGAYCLMLFKAWSRDNGCQLPNDEDKLARIAGLSVEQFRASNLMSRFHVSECGTYVFNPRQVTEWHAAIEKHKRQSEAGKRAMANRWNKEADKVVISNLSNGYNETDNNLTNPVITIKPNQTKPSNNSLAVSTETAPDTVSPKSEKNKALYTKADKLNIPFTQAWEAYGRKGSKPASAKRWLELSDAQRTAALSSIPAYFKKQPEAKYRKDFERYLANEVWEGQLAQPIEQRVIGAALTYPRLPYPSQQNEA